MSGSPPASGSHSFDVAVRVRAGWQDVLQAALARARGLGPRAVLAFDLDSTLFDNRSRQVRILREFGAAEGLDALAACEVHHWENGWDMRGAMARCGLPPDAVERHFPRARAFWAERFFTSAYCELDTPLAGASAFTHAVVATGAQLAYVTGRHEGMRAGSVVAMQKAGMVTPDGARVHLLMKPSLAVDDDSFKREAHAHLGTLGELVAAFDNEPQHANDYRVRFPAALVVHLATDHSGRPVELLEGIVSVPHFALGV